MQIKHSRRGSRLTLHSVMWIGGSTVGTLLAVLFCRPSAFDWMLLVTLLFISNLGISVGFHRLLSHRSFECAPALRYALLAMGCTAAQGPPGYWAILHRQHHRFSDRQGDPHSPLATDGGSFWRGFWHAHMGWIMEVGMPRLDRHSKDLVRDPVVRTMGRAYYPIALGGVAVPALLGGLYTGSAAGAISGLVWGGAVRLFLVHHIIWSINSVCHVWGVQAYDTGDTSRNNWLLALLSVGESWHNNHHAAAGSASFAHHWWQIDLGYQLIRLCARLGWAQRPRPIPFNHLGSIP